MCREAGGHGCSSPEEGWNMLLISKHPHVVLRASSSGVSDM